jgi:hypothetical protein
LLKKTFKEYEISSVLNSLLEDSEAECHDDHPEPDSPEAWVKMIDRGGLYHCTIEFFNFMYSMEIVIKEMMCTEKNDKLDLSKIEHNIKANTDVSIWWQCLCSEVSESLASSLLSDILKPYKKIRGFRYCAIWMERHKQDCKTPKQKEKSFRGKLQY